GAVAPPARARAALARALPPRRLPRARAEQPRAPASGRVRGAGHVSAPLVALALGYLLGGFPTAYLLARARGKDVFAVGSGSMGAMNTARNVAPALGVAVLLVDAGKGALAAFLGGLLAGLEPGQDPLLASLLGALGSVAGHCFSPYVGFRGGKGLATAFGALLVVHPAPPLYGLVLL